jgi:hypothetical protein
VRRLAFAFQNGSVTKNCGSTWTGSNHLGFFAATIGTHVLENGAIPSILPALKSEGKPSHSKGAKLLLPALVELFVPIAEASY